MPNRVDSEIDVQIWPVKVVGLRPFQIQNGVDVRLLEPREIVKRQEELLVIDEDPESVPGDVGYLSGRSAQPRRFGADDRPA